VVGGLEAVPSEDVLHGQDDGLEAGRQHVRLEQI
jgi:hypothetical protein